MAKGNKGEKRKHAEVAATEEVAPKKAKNEAGYILDGKGRVTVRVKCNQKKLLSKLLMEEFAESVRVEFAQKFKLGFIKFTTEEDLQRSIDRGVVTILGVPIEVKPNPQKKIKGAEGLVTGPLLRLFEALLQKHLHIDAMIANMGSGIICQVPLDQAERVFELDPVEIYGQSVGAEYHVREVLPLGAKPVEE